LSLSCLQFWIRRSLVHSYKFLEVRLQPLGSVSGTHEGNCFQKQRHQYWIAWLLERKLLNNVDKSIWIETSLAYHSYRLVELSIYRTELAGRFRKVLQGTFTKLLPILGMTKYTSRVSKRRDQMLLN
jgi:hypothetical protein